MGIEESEQKMKQEWSLLDTMVDLFDQTEKGVEFSEAANIFETTSSDGAGHAVDTMDGTRKVPALLSEYIL